MPSMDRRRVHERKKTAEQAEIPGIPQVVQPQRRERCRLDLFQFLSTYFPHSTGLSPLSEGHRRVIARLQGALLNGRRILNWVYRGFAKTTITENAAIWATLYGHRKYVAIFANNKGESLGLVDSITRELTTNEMLLEDFPEVCAPFIALEGKPQRASSQTYGGELTGLVMKRDCLVLPTLKLPQVPTAVPKGRRKKSEPAVAAAARFTAASGAIIKCRGLLGAARGMKHKRADGVQQRPDFVLIDDPQDDTSARSPQQVNRRLNVIRKGILLSGGHRTPLACAINATCIEANDLVQQLSDTDRFPEWEVEKIPMVTRWSDAHETIWQEYAELRRAFDRAVPGAREEAKRKSTAFYKKHRKEMDVGAVVSWDSCYEQGSELSAVQHAYNFYFDNGSDVFAAECQGEPMTLTPQAVTPLDAAQLSRHLHGHARGDVSDSAPHLVGMIDVHDDLLYWLITAWQPDCTGFIVDYGTFPDQNRAYFMKRDAPRTLQQMYGDVAREIRIANGMESLVDRLCGQEWTRTDSTPQRINRLLIDSGYCPDAVEQVCRTSPHAAVLQMSRGVGVRASECPISEYKHRTGWQIGDQWYIVRGAKRSLRVLRYDTNHWKLWLRSRLALAPPAPGSLSLFGQRGHDHRLLIDHLLSEQPIETQARGRTVIEWRLPPGRDNHWLDCTVGCSVAASLLGCQVNVQQKLSSAKSRRQRILEAARAKGM